MHRRRKNDFYHSNTQKSWSAPFTLIPLLAKDEEAIQQLFSPAVKEKHNKEKGTKMHRAHTHTYIHPNISYLFDLSHYISYMVHDDHQEGPSIMDFIHRKSKLKSIYAN